MIRLIGKNSRTGTSFVVTLDQETLEIITSQGFKKFNVSKYHRCWEEIYPVLKTHCCKYTENQKDYSVTYEFFDDVKFYVDGVEI